MVVYAFPKGFGLMPDPSPRFKSSPGLDNFPPKLEQQLRADRRSFLNQTGALTDDLQVLNRSIFALPASPVQEEHTSLSIEVRVAMTLQSWLLALISYLLSLFIFKLLVMGILPFGRSGSSKTKLRSPGTRWWRTSSSP